MRPASLLARGILGGFIAFFCSVIEGAAADRDIAWAAEPPVVDGVLDDEVWQQAQPIREFGQPWANSERLATRSPESTEARLL